MHFCATKTFFHYDKLAIWGVCKRHMPKCPLCLPVDLLPLIVCMGWLPMICLLLVEHNFAQFWLFQLTPLPKIKFLLINTKINKANTFHMHKNRHRFLNIKTLKAIITTDPQPYCGHRLSTWHHRQCQWCMPCHSGLHHFHLDNRRSGYQCTNPRTWQKNS